MQLRHLRERHADSCRYETSQRETYPIGRAVYAKATERHAAATAIEKPVATIEEPAEVELDDEAALAVDDPLVAGAADVLLL